jgi:hypothetical protein
VKLPERLDCRVDAVDYLRARSQLGSFIYQRFLTGTLLNVLGGFVAALVAEAVS